MAVHEQSPGARTPAITVGPLFVWSIILITIGLCRLLLGWLAAGRDNALADIARIQGTSNHFWPLVLALDILCWGMLACLPLGILLLVGVIRKSWAEVALCTSIIILVSTALFPLFAKAREGGGPSCLGLVRQLSTACLMYEEDNNGRFPEQWDEICQYLGGEKGRQYLLIDPTAKDRYRCWGGYGYNANLIGKSIAHLEKPESLFAVGDSIHPEMMITTFHDIDARHQGGYYAGFCDGHAGYFKGVPVRLK